MLVDQGYQVTVLEKSRGVGGRMSTRRAGESLQFDHGAQYFTVRDPNFRNHVTSWLRDGVAARWQGRIASVENGVIKEEKGDRERFVAKPGMSAICKHLATGIEIRLETEVDPPRRIVNQWRLTSDSEALGMFDTVIVSAPPAQSARLLEAAPKLADAAKSVKMEGCWALMLALTQPSSLEYSGAFVHGSPISWIARDSDKPGRTQWPETWVVHASSDWTASHLELSGPQTQRLLLNEFWKATGLRPQPLRYSSTHRWLYALPPEPLPKRCLFGEALQIGVCGDWCAGPRVEGAFLSGKAAAHAIMSSHA
jgi:predicted NAD/FAD-dependent oxidoreductase